MEIGNSEIGRQDCLAEDHWRRRVIFPTTKVIFPTTKQATFYIDAGQTGISSESSAGEAMASSPIRVPAGEGREGGKG